MIVEERINKLRKTNETTQKKLAGTMDVARTSSFALMDDENKLTRRIKHNLEPLR